MKRATIIALLLGPFAAAGRSQEAAAKEAPELSPDAWLNFPQFRGKTLAHLRGTTVLLEHWRTWCGPCKAQVPHMNQVHEKYLSRGLAVVGVTDEPEEKVKLFIEDQGIKYPIAIERSAASMNAFNVRGVPAAFLVDPKGNIVWSGHPAQLKDDDIEKALAGARPPGRLPESLQPAQKHLDREEFGKACEVLRKLLSEGGLSKEHASFASSFVASIESEAKDLFEASVAAAQKKDWWVAVTGFERLAKAYSGLPRSEEAAAKAKELRSDPKIQAAIEARKLEKEGAQRE